MTCDAQNVFLIFCKGTWGPDCRERCSCRDCDAVSGQCLNCPPGHIGPECNQRCPSYWWGDKCAQVCTASANESAACKRPDMAKKRSNNVCENINCGRGGWCDDGQCYCAPGYTGQRCQQKCKNDTWGIECLKSCDCGKDGKCDSIDGSCKCAPGFTGPTCDQTCPQGTFNIQILGLLD